jgi:phosphoglycerate kinase
MVIKYIDELDITEKRVFIRLDLNVPLDEDGNIADDTRIRAALPTVKYAIEKEARVILASHLGRPNGERNPKYSLRPVAARLAELLKTDIIFPEDCIGDAVRKLVTDLKSGDVVLLENLRFHKEETENDPNFAEKLAAFCDVYINDAFGTAHRAHASTVGITKYVSVKGAGFLMKKEVECLNLVVHNFERPFVAIIGGAKVSDKLGVIENLLSEVDTLIVGGGMAYTFLKAKGKEIGSSLFEPDLVHSANKIIERAATRGVKLLLPVDHVVGKECREGVTPIYTEDANVPADMLGLDIGKKTLKEFSDELSAAKTIFWNGPMGVCEIKPFQEGTFGLAEAVAQSGAMSVVGGGDSVAAIKKSGVAEKISHICTGGGARLEFLEGKKLPGIAALEQ